MRRRRLAVSVALTLALAGALALLWPRTPRSGGIDGGPPRTGPTEPAAPAPIEERAGPRAGLGGRPASESSSTAGETPATEPATGGFRVRGRVLSGGTPPPGSLVYALMRDPGNRDAYVARTPPAADGSYEFAVAAPKGEPPWYVQVGASLPGCREVRAEGDAEAGAVLELDLEIPEGVLLRGRVVDLAGRPVAGLRLGIVNGGSNVFTWDGPPDRATAERVGSWDSSLVATATTDGEGRFEVRGLQPTALSAASYDDAWSLEPANGHFLMPGDEEGVLRARPAFRLEVAVTPADPSDDPEGWKPLAMGFQIVEPHLASAWSMSGARLPIRLRSGVPDAALAGFTARLKVDTVDHRLEERMVDFGPGAWSRRVEIALVRRSADEMGTVLVTSSLRDAAGKPPRLTLLHQRRTTENSWTGNWIPLVARDDFAWTATLPIGPQHVEVHADLPLKDLLTWKGEVEVPARGEARIAYPPFPVGRVLVRFPAAASGAEVVVMFQRIEPLSTSTWMGKPADGGLVLPAVPAGPWRVTFQRGGSSTHRELEVAAGAETVIDLGP